MLCGCYHNTEIIVLVNVVQHGLYLTVGAFGQHVEEIWKEVIGVVWFICYWHCKAYWFAMIVFVVYKNIFACICFRKNACFYIVDVDFTFSHNPAA